MFVNVRPPPQGHNLATLSKAHPLDGGAGALMLLTAAQSSSTKRKGRRWQVENLGLVMVARRWLHTF